MDIIEGHKVGVRRVVGVVAGWWVWRMGGGCGAGWWVWRMGILTSTFLPSLYAGQEHLEHGRQL